MIEEFGQPRLSEADALGGGIEAQSEAGLDEGERAALAQACGEQATG